jgi:toxin ParE1/3/4
MRAVIERLRSSPRLGRPLQDTQLRKCPCGSHVIFYRIDSVTLEVVRVLHQRMDFSARLSDET